jgi:hypothetical protein
MSRLFKVLQVFALCLFVAGPALAAPAVQTPHIGRGSPAAPAPFSALARVGLTLAAMVGVAITVKDTASTGAKFSTRAQAAAPDYTKGVQGAGPKWLDRSKASEENYKQGVTAAANRGAYGQGLAKHGSDKYQNNAVNLGSQRYPTGVANAQAAYVKGVDPYLNILRSADLPARGPKGSPQNQQRASAVATLLRKAKVGG